MWASRQPRSSLTAAAARRRPAEAEEGELLGAAGLPSPVGREPSLGSAYPAGLFVRKLWEANVQLKQISARVCSEPRCSLAPPGDR